MNTHLNKGVLQICLAMLYLPIFFGAWIRIWIILSPARSRCRNMPGCSVLYIVVILSFRLYLCFRKCFAFDSHYARNFYHLQSFIYLGCTFVRESVVSSTSWATHWNPKGCIFVGIQRFPVGFHRSSNPSNSYVSRDSRVNDRPLIRGFIQILVKF